MTTPEEVVAQYRPNGVDPETWQQIGPLVREVVTRTGFRALSTYIRAMSVATGLVGWAQREGIDLDIESVFSPATVDRYTAVGMPQYTDRARSTRRAMLRTVARAVTKKAPWEPKPETLARNTMRAPYSNTEIDRLWEIAGQQPDGQRQRSAKTLFTLGLGAGLTPVDLLHVTAADVRREHRAVVVRTPGELGRDVPVRARWAPELLKLADQYPDGPLVGPLGTSRNRLNVLLSRIVRTPDMPNLSVHRLRTTWMIHVLNSGTPVSEFMRAAGWSTGSRLGELLPYLTVREPEKSWPQLAGNHD
ncbi:hypothetical protein ABLG96_01760 [Nakamurella sp. A5-74]|uniref:Tyr recombinase domain-containing protein n=1 Tax=Nakamurella sp. A5-74 TaxID=3158264 RepID=A0AAU8DP85_9ACTN